MMHVDLLLLLLLRVDLEIKFNFQICKLQKVLNYIPKLHLKRGKSSFFPTTQTMFKNCKLQT